jgi:hypothetical protein
LSISKGHNVFIQIAFFRQLVYWNDFFNKATILYPGGIRSHDPYVSSNLRRSLSKGAL